MVTDLNQLAKNIIEQNEYLSLATVDANNSPWISTLAYAYDEKLNFYFLSLPTSKHSENIKHNGRVAFSIYDSRQNFGYGVGLQIEGTVLGILPTQHPLRKELEGELRASVARTIFY